MSTIAILRATHYEGDMRSRGRHMVDVVEIYSCEHCGVVIDYHLVWLWMNMMLVMMEMMVVVMVTMMEMIAGQEPSKASAWWRSENCCSLLCHSSSQQPNNHFLLILIIVIITIIIINSVPFLLSTSEHPNHVFIQCHSQWFRILEILKYLESVGSNKV